MLDTTEHDINSDAELDDSCGRSAEKVRPSRPRSKQRADGRRRAAVVLDRLATRLGWTTCDIARALGIDEKRARDIRRGERAFEVGDLELLGPLGRAIQETILAEAYAHTIAPEGKDALRSSVRLAMAEHLAIDCRTDRPSSPDLERSLHRVTDACMVARARLFRKDVP